MSDEIEVMEGDLGRRVRQLRLSRNLDQSATAEKAGISLRALSKLENGHGSNLETLLRTLRALDYVKGIEMLAPQPTINPLTMLQTPRPPQRVRRPRKRREGDRG
jgi:transcriptional regulator with XRE-family HTH domain